MKVYFIRHGETVGLVTRRVQGWTEVDLTEHGKKQAERARELVRDIEFKRIYCSDLRRTVSTANIVFGNDAELIFDERVREINNTPLAGQYGPDILAKHGEKYLYARDQYDYTEFGGESAEHFISRIRSFLDMLRELSQTEEFKNANIAVVTHGGFIRGMTSVVVGAPISKCKVTVSNCSITVIQAKMPFDEWHVKALNFTGTI